MLFFFLKFYFFVSVIQECYRAFYRHFERDVADSRFSGLVDMVMWRGVQNGTAQVQYASCYAGVLDGCWYAGVHRMPFLTGPATNQHTAARLGLTNVLCFTRREISLFSDDDCRRCGTSASGGS